MNTLNNSTLSAKSNDKKPTLSLNNKKSFNTDTKKSKTPAKPAVVDDKKVDMRKVHKILFATHNVLREFKPLVIKDIVKQLFNYYKENPCNNISKTTLRRFLNYHVNSYKYLKNITEQTRRFNLNGSIAQGENSIIDDEAKRYSKEKLTILEQKAEKNKKTLEAKKRKFNNNNNKNKKFNNKKTFNNLNNSNYRKNNNKNEATTNTPKIYTKSTFKKSNYAYKSNSTLKNTTESK